MTNHPCTDCLARYSVNDDKTSGVSVVDVWVISDRPIGSEITNSNVIELKSGGCEVLKRVDVDLVFGFINHDTDSFCANLEQIRTMWHHLVLVSPDHECFKLIADVRY